MQSQKIEILKIKAISAYQKADAKGKELLKNLIGENQLNGDLKSYVKTFEDICEVAGVDIRYYNIPDNATPEQCNIINYRKLMLIYQVFNGDWRPDFKDKKQNRYYPYFEHKTSGFAFADVTDCSSVYSGVSSRLCSHSSEVAEYIGRQFIDIYEAYLTK